MRIIDILSLRPTQLTAGFREVELRRRRLRQTGFSKDDLQSYHQIPVVSGPKGHSYILDHHHLALALHLEGVSQVVINPMADLSALSRGEFWFVMERMNWVYLYDRDGILRTSADIPKTIEKLKDDPFRSLAGELRRQGGFAKDTTLYSEFLWAEFLRRRIGDRVDHDYGGALKKALKLAKSKQANYLPGWCGRDPDE
ncbi:hypothetical protein K32_24570 [Kaistia sp. 32K]|uniref:ParB-like protein n=1 Tax=Kaistia sp. 32K TaxID=2795690 RepID=UPI0019161CA6|nr:ParB-like protein [Kaistia sp. 32K]BCP53840.1 hypothetical protein K32_24570 [Kaistia sp. 32K]